MEKKLVRIAAEKKLGGVCAGLHAILEWMYQFLELHMLSLQSLPDHCCSGSTLSFGSYCHRSNRCISALIK